LQHEVIGEEGGQADVGESDGGKGERRNDQAAKGRA
jgi:hypothetical protein